MDMTVKGLRARFKTLTDRREKIVAAATPLREKRDKVVAKYQKYRDEETALNEQITRAEKGLFDLDMERAAVVRALGGKVSEPEDTQG